MEGLFQDLRYGFRMLVQRPGFTAVVLVTLALGIGANTAIFTVVNAVLLRPLPYRDPGRLVILWRSMPQQGRDQLLFSYPDFADLRDRAKGFDGMSVCAFLTFNLTGVEAPERVRGAIVSANFFSVFGEQPLLGRGFVSAEDNPGGPRVVVLSHNLWQRRFGSDPELIGKTVALDGESYEVVGVMPADFKLFGLSAETEVWIPFGLDPFKNRRFARGVNSLGVFARLKPGTSPEQAQAEVETLALQLERQFPADLKGWKLRVVSLHEQAVQGIRRSLLVLLAAVGFVLLIACSNVANLLLSRATGRQKEMAIRAALGAGRMRLIRQMLLESLLLAAGGGTLGLLFSLWGVDLLALLPYRDTRQYTPYIIPREQVGLDGTVLFFTAGLSLASVLFFGLVPALWASKTDPQESLKDLGGRRLATLGRQPAKSFLVISEIALSTVLLAGAGLMMKSFLRLLAVDPGFRPENVLTADIGLPQSRYQDSSRVAATYRQILERIQGLPGIVAAGVVEYLPLSGRDSSTDIFIEGKPIPGPGQEMRVHYRDVSADYFRAMGIRLIEGRQFTGPDAQDSPRVAMINETLARRYWSGENPIGKRLALHFESLRFHPDRAPDLDIRLGMREVVGIVADVKHSKLEAAPVPEVFVPYLQRPVGNMTLVVRATSDPASLIASVRQEVYAVDKELPVSNVNTLSQLMADAVSQPRYSMLLFSVFAAMALVLAAVGVYGVLSYSVTQRTREIGIRIALGARSGDVLRMIVKQGMLLSAIGIALGLAAALAVTRILSGLLFEVSASDPVVFAAISLVLVVLALIACYLPAHRGTKVEPVAALRCE